MVSTFDAAVIQVTGFVNHRRLAEVGSALGAALASRGRKVVRRLPDSAPGDAREVSLSEQERDASPHVVRVKCLHPISADLSFREAARISPALVCVVPVGEVPERDVRSFQDRALESGIASLSFVLLRS